MAVPAASAPPPVEVPVSAPVPIAKPKDVYRETGVAAWYGQDMHGKKTASGEVFDMYGLSAAHRTLPLGTVVIVTNLDNFKSITVKINDRGPFIKSRFLDMHLCFVDPNHVLWILRIRDRFRFKYFDFVLITVRISLKI